MSVTLVKITPVQHLSAIEWLACTFPEVTIFDRFTAPQTYRTIQRHYDGGWNGFLSDLGSDSWV